MNAALVKFAELSPLHGYGFDIQADRVVRFDKHADGTYLNTRATYSINKQQFTHFALRAEAIKQQGFVSDMRKTEATVNRNRWLVAFVAFFIVLASISRCTITVDTEQAVEEQAQ